MAPFYSWRSSSHCYCFSEEKARNTSNPPFRVDLFFRGAFDKIRVTYYRGMANEITVHVIDKKFEALKNPVRKIVLEILGVLKKEGVAIEVLLLGNAKMRSLNRGYRGKDSATNVLSFEEPKQFVYPKNTMKRKGEIYLNPEMSSDWWMKKSKKKATKGSPERSRRAEEFLDIRFLLVHGVLHLFGYDHIEDGDAAKMERKEAAIMKSLKS